LSNIDEKLLARQVKVLCDGMCETVVLLFFEEHRSEEARSKEWRERQMLKVDLGGLMALSQRVGDERKEFPGSVLGYMNVCGSVSIPGQFGPWTRRCSGCTCVFSRAVLRIMLLQSFKDTVPRPQTIKD
jgi:glutathione S-transferase